MLSAKGFHLLMPFSEGRCSVDFFKLGIGDTVAATIKHLDEFNVIYQGFHSMGKKDLFGWLNLSSAYSKHQILSEGFHQPLQSWMTVFIWPLFFSSQ